MPFTLILTGKLLSRPIGKLKEVNPQNCKSSCESDLILGNGKYDKGLAKEHEEWTGEIERIVKEESY